MASNRPAETESDQHVTQRWNQKSTGSEISRCRNAGTTFNKKGRALFFSNNTSHVASTQPGVYEDAVVHFRCIGVTADMAVEKLGILTQ